MRVIGLVFVFSFLCSLVAKSSQDSLPKSSLEMLTECLAQTPVGAQASHVRESFFSFRGIPRVERRNSGFFLVAPIFLQYQDGWTDSSIAQGRTYIDDLRTFTENFLAEYGWKIDLSFRHSVDEENSEFGDIVVEWFRRFDFVFMQPQTWPWQIITAEKTYTREEILWGHLHEILHLFDLPDEYLEAFDGSIGYIGPEDSIMANPFHQPRPRLYPEHTRRMLRPLCTVE